ncbi:hypothetical protein Sulku_1248 [Sulfuricurvum kujiense DSM 16994]|uniref:Uncharacterized protein n=1 Tax=Sulfuricurvum kujiense (strain ATCC BAA-921 / DSM 16994 / JCM 11577 / YK-1) TaxID=709032 RepID=E4TXK2_SULKY|nr:DUF190 domain-containing protein [Sulfuricurvum kujiense]ADR33911.1 hypothetical protein Sulku_1248 [Sulfuricurvum kujiense DSM 16994]
MKTGFQLTFYTLRSRRHNGASIADWLEEIAQKAGISGVTVTNASKGLGHDGKWHSASFFELTDQPLEIIMIADAEACDRLFTFLETEKPNLFYTKTAIEYGTI